jgi:DNA excision repair protein ERCC-2
MRTIHRILHKNSNIIFESGTGSGKTICTIFEALKFAIKKNKKIIYITRTNAQQRQVILELRNIRNKNPGSINTIIGVAIQGRTNMCMIARNNPDLSNGTSEELSRFCSGEKKKVKSNTDENVCLYYLNYLDSHKSEKALRYFKENLPTAEEFIFFCKKMKICPYETSKKLIKESSLIVAPYVYIFSPLIRNMFFNHINIDINNMILIVDEAHNLPNYIRDIYSSRLSINMLKNCINESDKYGNPSLIDNIINISGFCKILIEIIYDLRDTYIHSKLESGKSMINGDADDAFIPPNEFETEILSRIKITSKKLKEAIAALIAYGEKIQDYSQKAGKLPRSYIHKLGQFLDFWINIEMDQYAKLVIDSNFGKNARIEAYCLDPSVGSDIIHHFYATIHMSGTMEPLEEYRDSIGLNFDTKLVSFPSPFLRKNLKIFFTEDVTTKYDEMLKDNTNLYKIINYVANICNFFPKNTMIFFPSYNIMNIFRRNRDFSKIKRSIFFEEQYMSQSALMELISDFKDCGYSGKNKATLLSVIGGRISEGIDFPSEELEIAVIVGIPYPKPSAKQRALQRYYDFKFRKGWEYTVEAPTARKLLQSIGRLIRNENDRAVAVILDWRAIRFKKYIGNLELSKDLVDDIKRFLN